MLQKKLKIGVIEACYSPYRNLWYLIKKSTLRKNRLINITVEFNQTIIRDVNLSFSTNKFSEKFVGCAISFFQDLFLSYNYVELDKKSQDLTALMNPLSLMHMTILT